MSSAALSAARSDKACGEFEGTAYARPMSDLTIKLPDGSERLVPAGTTVGGLAVDECAIVTANRRAAPRSPDHADDRVAIALL